MPASPSPMRPSSAPAPSRPASSRPLGGALAVIFWCVCGITAIPLAGAFSLIAALGTSGAASAISDTLSGDSLQAQVLRLGLIPQVVLFAWAAALVALTIARSRLALSVAPWGLLAWVVVTAMAQFSIRNALAPDGLTIGDLAALVPGLLLQGAGAAALFGYFREGERPKGYYVR